MNKTYKHTSNSFYSCLVIIWIALKLDALQHTLRIPTSVSIAFERDREKAGANANNFYI